MAQIYGSDLDALARLELAREGHRDQSQYQWTALALQAAENARSRQAQMQRGVQTDALQRERWGQQDALSREQMANQIRVAEIRSNDEDAWRKQAAAETLLQRKAEADARAADLAARRKREAAENAAGNLLDAVQQGAADELAVDDALSSGAFNEFGDITATLKSVAGTLSRQKDEVFQDALAYTKQLNDQIKSDVDALKTAQSTKKNPTVPWYRRTSSVQEEADKDLTAKQQSLSRRVSEVTAAIDRAHQGVVAFDPLSLEYKPTIQPSRRRPNPPQGPQASPPPRRGDPLSVDFGNEINGGGAPVSVPIGISPQANVPAAAQPSDPLVSTAAPMATGIQPFLSPEERSQALEIARELLSRRDDQGRPIHDQNSALEAAIHRITMSRGGAWQP